MMDDDGNRSLQIVGDSYILANNGFKGHFLKNGQQQKKINLGRTAEYGYKNLISAWNNNFGEPRKSNTDLNTTKNQKTGHNNTNVQAGSNQQIGAKKKTKTVRLNS